MKVVIDADACPKKVLEGTLSICAKYDIKVWTVANYNHEIKSDNHIVVGSASQEADIKIMNIIDQGDIAVTQDYGLAAMIIAKGAACISPTGKEYTNKKIDFMLEERNLKARFRRNGGRTRGPSKRTQVDDINFAKTFEEILQQTLRSKPNNNLQQSEEMQ